MTTIKIHKASLLDMWIKQNEADIIDSREGCMLDNLLAECRRGVAIIYEAFVNSWESEYKVKFAKYNTPEADGLYSEWDFFCCAYDEGCE